MSQKKGKIFQIDEALKSLETAIEDFDQIKKDEQSETVVQKVSDRPPDRPKDNSSTLELLEKVKQQLQDFKSTF